MKTTHPITQDLEKENRKLRQANAEARALLGDTAQKLHTILQEDIFMEETPIEILTAGEIAVEAIRAALRCLESAAPAKRSSAMPPPGGPTHQQGQFLAFIREYMLQNHAGVAPTHAALQKFFNLSAPSVNSMLIRLERRGFIRRIPHQARAIELIVNLDWIPPLDRPFRF